ncbi:HP1 family phage holin [Shewanella acanthi]|uniref:HP1 family phage holin n=1 Tax=Shewanella acanthi TaxID=2864212 RepID=UPI001C65F240|nr:HP1 family phage holin [Shewanella acanthi]QYJ79419.1 phage holin family protein [Shewanella acanthi]
MSNPYINDVSTQKGLSLTAYLSSFISTLGGALSMNDVAILIGILLAVLTYIGNMFYQELRRRREQRQEEKDEQRAQELHSAEMQLLAAQLEKVQHGTNQTPRGPACPAE